MSGYGEAGASWNRRALKGMVAQSLSPIEDIDFNNATMRQRGRILYMSAPVAAAAINTARTKIVGSGLRPNVLPNREILNISDEEAQAWAKKTESEFKLWAEKKQNCDALGNNNFFELQQLIVKSWLTSGDSLTLLKRDFAANKQLNPYSLRLHVIEADRVSTPIDYMALTVGNTEGVNTENNNKIHDGIEVDKNGKVIAYYISREYPNQIFYSEDNKWDRVLAVGEKSGIPNAIHVMDAERPDQYRGVSYLAPVIEIILQLRRYVDSSLVSALIQSYFTAWITTNATDTTEFPFEEIGENGATDSAGGVSKSSAEYEMGPGAINVLEQGEDIKFGNPNMPIAGFEAFVKTIEQMTGAALEIPRDVLVKEFNASYSASKGALEEMWESVKMRRNWFIADFCQPVYETWLAEAVAIGRIKAPGFFDNPLIRDAWCGVRWDGPAQTHLNPVAEAKANEILVANGWKTNAQITREHYGGNWLENMAALEQERKIMLKIFGGSDNAESGANNQSAD